MATICYLALKPSPSLQDIPLMPRPFGRWLEQYDFLCNVSGFWLLTLVVHATWARWREEEATAVAWRALPLIGLVAGLETMQWWLPKRVFDLHDIAAGWLGVALGSLPWLLAAVVAAKAEPKPARATDGGA